MLVHTNYTPYNHYLACADRNAREVLPDMEVIFPVETEVDDELFKRFDYAYIGARYDPNFTISKEELEYLSGRVERLLHLTEKRCRARIESLDVG